MIRMSDVGAAAAVVAATLAPVAAQAPSFDYDRSRPIDVRQIATADRSGVTVREITYAKLDGSPNAATLVLPPASAKRPSAAVLFVHWYEPPKPTSNRTEFVEDAVELASMGTVSLLIDTPWSEPTWFPKRNSEQDYEMSIGEVRELRRALDVLLLEPRIDPARVAYVGHDFGAMYGALAVAADPRPKCMVFMAGAESFSDWFLYQPKREGDARRQFIAKLAPLDPIAWLPRIAPRSVLLQFATRDQFVSTEAAARMANVIAGPKTVKYYEAEHALNADATRDRQAWLKQQLELDK